MSKVQHKVTNYFLTAYGDKPEACAILLKNLIFDKICQKFC